MPEQYDDRELERIMREGLHARAGEAPERLGPEGLGPGVEHRAPGGRSAHRRAWLLGTAAAVVLLVGTPLALRVAGEPDARPAATEDASTAPAPTDGWRVESYGGVQVRVPPDWGWGGAPMPDASGGKRPMDCGAAPFVVPGSDDYEFVPQDTPYVGRPLMMTDACSIPGLPNAPEEPAPAADSVWLGAEVEPGRVDLGDGFVRETVPVGNSVVTVTSDDPELRATILDTAEAVDVDANGCRTEGDWSSFPDGTLRDVEPRSLSVCAYATRRGATVLVWSARGDADAAAAYAGAVDEASATYDPGRLCTDRPDGEWLAIGVRGAGDRIAWTSVALGDCAQILWHYRAQGDPESLAASPVLPRTVAPWASPWTRAYLAGPSGWEEHGKAGRGMFRGYLG